MQQETLAYDLSLFEERPRKEPRLRVTPRNRRVKVRAGFVWIRTVGMAALLLALVISVLCAHVQSTELSAQLLSTQNKLQDLMNDYKYLSTEIEMKTNLTAVQTYAANVLQMVKLDRSQVTYVTDGSENSVERPEGGISRLWEKVLQSLQEFGGGSD